MSGIPKVGRYRKHGTYASEREVELENQVILLEGRITDALAYLNGPHEFSRWRFARILTGEPEPERKLV